MDKTNPVVAIWRHFRPQNTDAIGDLKPTYVKKEELPLKVDPDIIYSYNYKDDANDETKKLIEVAQQQQIKGDCRIWDSKFELPKTHVMAKFASEVYNNSSLSNVSEIIPESPWKLLYAAIGKKVFNGFLDGFYGELYFNTENRYLLLVVKGTSSLGNTWSDIKNVGLGLKGGEIDSAFTFGETVRRLICEFKCRPMLLVTGHSLGGYLAQIITYTVTYCYEGEIGKVRSREEPTHDFETYTTVFDAPAVFKQLCSLDPHDPLDMKRFELPIINFVKDVNIVNSNSLVGPHLGQVVAIEAFSQREKPGLLTKLINTVSSHGMTNFEFLNKGNIVKLQHLPSKATAVCSQKEIPSFFFSRLNFERLHKFSFIASMNSELMSELPKFRITNSCIYIEDEHVCVEEFIPRAYQVLSNFNDMLESGLYNGKKILDMAVYSMWRADMLEDAHEFRLNEEMQQQIKDLMHGAILGGYTSFNEMRFIGCLIHNSIPNAYHYDYKKFKTMDDTAINNLLSNSEITLILIVDEKIKNIKYPLGQSAKILYLAIDDEVAEKISFVLAALDECSKHQLKMHMVDFMGNKVCTSDLFGTLLLQELPIWTVINFHKKQTHKDENMKIDLAFSCTKLKKKFNNASNFANELKSGDLSFVVIASNMGMRRSIALKQIAVSLQNELPSFWIELLSLFSMQNKLMIAKDNIKSKEDAIEFVKNVALDNYKNSATLKKIFDFKFLHMKMIFLFDAYDDIGPQQRVAAISLIELLRKTNLQMFVTARSQEVKRFAGAVVYELHLSNDVGQLINSTPNKLSKESIQKTTKNTSTTASSSDTIRDGNKLMEKLAICFIFKAGEISEEFQKEVAENRTSINDSGEAEIYNDDTNVSFHYKSKADDYVAAAFVSQIETLETEETLTKYQLRRILVGEEFSLIRNRICNKLAGTSKSKYTPDFIYEIKNELLKIFIQEDSYELYMLWKDTIAKARDNCVIIDNDGHSVNILYFALKYARREFVETFLTDGANFEDIVNDEFVLHMAIKLQFFEEIIVNFEALKSTINVIDDKSKTPLMYAIGSCNIEMIKFLIENGANVSIKDDSEKNALYYAIQDNNRELVDILINIPETDLGEALKWTLYLEQNKLYNAISERIIDDGLKTNYMQLALDEEAATWCRKRIIIRLCSLGANPTKLDSKGQSSVHYLAKKGKLSTMKYVASLLKPEDYNIRNVNGETPLMIAIEENQEDIVQCLMQNKVSAIVDQKEIVRPILHYATERGSLNCVKLFEETSEEGIDHVDSEGRTAIFCAAYMGHVDILKYLLGRSANPALSNLRGENCLHAATLRNNLKCVKLLVEHLPIDCRNDDQDTPLNLAVKSGFLEIVAVLLMHSADPNIANMLGVTSLHSAAYHGNLEIVEVLIASKANVFARDNDGKSCLHYACEGQNSCIKFFADYVTIIDFVDNKGCSALFYVTENGDLSNLNYLLDKSADPNLKNIFGNTCLHIACQKNYYGIAMQLINCTTYECSNKKGDTPLHVASLFGSKDIVKCLLQDGANPHLKNNNGDTCLHYATKGGNLEIVKMLVEKSCNIGENNFENESPMLLAKKINDEAVLMYFESVRGPIRGIRKGKAT